VDAREPLHDFQVATLATCEKAYKIQSCTTLMANNESGATEGGALNSLGLDAGGIKCHSGCAPTSVTTGLRFVAVR
jgi:hypothetical protein